MSKMLRIVAVLMLVTGCDLSETTNVTPTEPGSPPVPGFTLAVNGLTVTVTDTSVDADVVSYDWGDGLSDSFASGSHTYSAAGNYTIVQTASNAHGSETTSRTATVGDTDPPPVAAFEVANITGLTVSFRDRSTNAEEWLWDFGDGEIDTLRSPNHTYPASGSYTVILTVRNGSGDEDRTDQTITLQDFPVAGFTVAIDGLTVTVTDTSSGADTVLYDWGDGSNDSFRSGPHTYSAAGSYAIQQRVSNDAGEDVLTQTVTVAP